MKSTTDCFIDNVNAIIDMYNINQVKLAERAGVTQGGLSDLLQKNGRSPTLDYCEKIAHALGLPVAALLVPDMAHPVLDLPMDNGAKKNWRLKVVINDYCDYRGLLEDPRREVLEYTPDEEDTQEDIEWGIRQFKHDLIRKKNFTDDLCRYLRDIKNKIFKKNQKGKSLLGPQN